jgi:hypothetical protein
MWDNLIYCSSTIADDDYMVGMSVTSDILILSCPKNSGTSGGYNIRPFRKY